MHLKLSRGAVCENTNEPVALDIFQWAIGAFLMRDGPKTEKTKEYKYLRMKKERPRDSRALGDKGWRRCWCAMNKNSWFWWWYLNSDSCMIDPGTTLCLNVLTQTIFCCVLLMWKTNSGECPDPIVWTFSRVDFWKRHISHIQPLFRWKAQWATLL